MYRPRLRTRAGCIKCKSRRKKCDEVRPICTACRRWNFTCVWPNTSYQAQNAQCMNDRGESITIAGPSSAEDDPQEQQSHEIALLDASVPEFSIFRYGPSWDYEERQAFDSFCSEMSNTMSGVFRVSRETNIWSFMLLQAAHQDDAVRHAICALGALHRSSLSESVRQRHHIRLLAAEQYNRAVKCTIRSTVHNHMTVDAILVMCILFTLLERLLGDIETAMSHLRAGMKLLTEPPVQPVTSLSSNPAVDPATPMPRATTVALLRRLERQIYELGQTHLESDVPRAPLFRIDIPVVFPSLEDACTSFEFLLNNANYLMHTCEWRDGEQYQAQKPIEPDLVFLIQRTLSRWNNSFRAFLRHENLENDRGPKTERLMVRTLHLWRLILHISLLHYQTGDEMICDHLTPEFAEAVAHCEAVVRAQKQPLDCDTWASGGDNVAPPKTGQTGRADFASPLTQPPVCPQHSPPGTSQRIYFDRPGKPVITCSPFSPLPALFTIAFRCRDPIIRRDAIRLLGDVDWCDAFWDSKISSRFAERLVQIEENGYLAGQKYSGRSRRVERAQQIPLSARCRQVRAQFLKPHTYVFEYHSVNANEWVPGPRYWNSSSPDSFCEVGRIRETWVVASD